MPATSFQVQLLRADKLEQELRRIQAHKVPIAVRNALNTMVFEGRTKWRNVMESTFTLRNKWTVGSIRVDKAKGSKVDDMSATLGSLAPYMATQEEGGTKDHSGKHGVAIPTGSAAGQGKSAKRTKQVRRKNYLGAIHVSRVSASGASLRGKSGKRRKNYLAVLIAQRTGKSAYLETPKAKGLFAVSGSASRPKIKMLYDLSHGSVNIPASKTLETTVEHVGSMATHIMLESLRKELPK